MEARVFGMKWIIAGVVVIALLVAWVVLSLASNRRPVTTCPSGSIRVHENCIRVTNR
jgi:hypothetical protein